MDERRIMPELTEGEYLAKSCDVCDIDHIIGTEEDVCTLHYSDPGVEYDYGYDFVNVIGNRQIHGYYVGIDRFCLLTNGYGKEYLLYEYAVFDDEDPETVNELLFRHLLTLAKVTGCSRITFIKRGGNSLFTDYFLEHGFRECDESLELSIEGAALSNRDKLVLPTEEDALGFKELFFLREQGFILDSEKCYFEAAGEWIVIDRRSGACHFSSAFEVIGGEMKLGDTRELTQIDVCCQLLKKDVSKDIRIYTSKNENNDFLPAIIAGDIGIFLPERTLNMKERNDLRQLLRQDGRLKRYAVYYFRFNYEVGGERIILGFSRV